MNGTSQQPTSRQNRRSEAADDAGIARKQRAMALTPVHPGNGQTPPLALPESCRRNMR